MKELSDPKKSIFECVFFPKAWTYTGSYVGTCWPQWPRGLRRRSAAARLLRLWVRIPLGPWMFVCCECCVLSGRGLCDGLITRPEESYRLWCVSECDLENFKEWGGHSSRFGCKRHKKNRNIMWSWRFRKYRCSMQGQSMGDVFIYLLSGDAGICPSAVEVPRYILTATQE